MVLVVPQPPPSDRLVRPAAAGRTRRTALRGSVEPASQAMQYRRFRQILAKGFEHHDDS
jgi:hypothetical protein